MIVKKNELKKGFVQCREHNQQDSPMYIGPIAIHRSFYLGKVGNK